MSSSTSTGPAVSLDRAAACELAGDLAAAAPVEVCILGADGREIAVAGAASGPIATGRREAAEAEIVANGRTVGTVRVRWLDAGPGRAGAVARFAAGVLAQRASLEAELDGMAEDLLSRYEEITMLFELGDALGAVFDVEDTCRIAVDRALLAVRADQGLVVLDPVDPPVGTVSGGAPTAAAEALARHVAADGRPLLLHEEQALPGPDGPASAPAPLLAVPLVSMAGGEEAAPPLGALALSRAPGAARFTAGDLKLAASVAMQLAAAVRSTRLVGSLREAERITREVEIAATVQRALLPGEPPPAPGLQLAGRCVPAANVGGDLYDHLVDRQGRIWLVIADVAGHSVGSALLMAMARTVLRREIADGRPPADVLAATNSTLFGDLAAASLFITLFCARLDPALGELRFASGGQNPPLLRRADGELIELDADGMPAGFLPDVTYEERRIEVRSGDLIVLYTDGVIEAQADDGAMFGERQLRALVETAGSVRPEEVVARIFREVQAHAGADEQADDITLLAARLDGATE